MTKVYLVCKKGCNPDGTLDPNSQMYVQRVFTNRKLARSYADYMNQNWELGFHRNANFKKDEISFYYIDSRSISKIDFSKMPF